ncbi:asparagine synthase (glutamine-hydrolyzing) [Geomonas subterranea]|uniref:asparagine synthase (glutamine-hydrolyzing) n=1 Tax=Geomonas subterranea TaxID=2847989 RepID=A0ABX8LLB9_9BACT|nr:asparagine synthase (glutamine-hydrolyzing) [Geomonas subterranea]QXE90360.1 asparagine synthase (glutamine-hydrolyzing) [Geomonas subterranea]QXM07512.1 asparagine synthase (glutamine-hydrolyzing) [Geomonas subterranea]
MCGIVGIYAPGKGEWDRAGLAAMLGRVRHRGPDGEGMHLEPGLFFGHARLAVLDLSEAGRQPMPSPDGRYLITYNGEIYNFRELRAELQALGHSFTTRTDTEVLLAAWVQWGEAALSRLDGIFAFAVADRYERTLWLARDPLGIKPLFYQDKGGEIFFASELLALFGPLNPVPPHDPCDLDSYFTFNYLPAPRTGLAGVRQLPPGTLLKATPARTELKRFWRPAGTGSARGQSPCEAGKTAAQEERVAEFRARLDRAVAAQTVSDAPLGLFLSGGLDSYAVARSATRAGLRPTAFTLAFDEAGFDESPAAADYARHLGIEHRVVRFQWNEETIRDTLASMRELLADASLFPMHQLCAFARKEATVILAGDGGDELLAGYDTYLAGELTPLIRRLPAPLRDAVRSLARFLPSDSQRYGARILVERILDAAAEGPDRDHATFRRICGNALKNRIFSPGLQSALSGSDPVAEYAALIGEASKTRSSLGARQQADIQFHLPSVLAKVDRTSMAHGLEVRVPILADDLVGFCLDLPDEAKRRGRKGKLILRQALADDIPAAALTRRKAGFLPPVDRWFAQEGPMAGVFRDYLAQGRENIAELDWNQVQRLWDEHKKGSIRAGFPLLGILQFINWSLACRSLRT